MKFLFEDQPHQAAAVAAVTDLFEGVVRAPTDDPYYLRGAASGHARFQLDLGELQGNLRNVAQRELAQEAGALQLLEETDLLSQERIFPNFSIEMETGTGKTYVYIATALRLAELYGLRKFVILVHSVAIRAGVVKTFTQTADHFQAKFPSISYRWGVLGQGPAYDDFVEPSSTVQFLIASIQAVDKPTSNSIYQEPEQPQLWDIPSTGIAGLAAIRPVVIIDEPQNMATALRRRAIATINPIFALRYSATHREKFNLIHKLGPKAAAENGLVKRVSVKGISPASTTSPYLRFVRIRSVKNRLMAEVIIDQMAGGDRERGTVVLQCGEDLFEVSNGIAAYEGYVVELLERKPDRLTFEVGLSLTAGDEIGIDREAVWRDQIRHTIRQHLNRQADIDATGNAIKVLSLFFIDRVADYLAEDAWLPKTFDEIYRSEWVRAGLAPEDCPDPGSLRTAYFASTKTGIFKDTSGLAQEADREARAYEEIIAHKELLLTRENPRAFIFSHSALREGWDNPNVFQVCFLRHTHSELERRQQIGRGLRLPVDEGGRRVTDPAVCRLTLIVDESFAAFRDGLNQEYEAAGATSPQDKPPPPQDADTEITVRRREDLFESPEFAELWNRIRYKARYRVTLDADALPAAVANSERLSEMAFLARRANVVESADLIYNETGKVITPVATVAESKGETIVLAQQTLPDLLRLIEDQLATSKFPMQLTRRTLAEILACLPLTVRKRAIDDPDRWARLVASAIRTTTIEKMVDHISYEPMADSDWWSAEVVFLQSEKLAQNCGGTGSSSGIAPASPHGRNLFDHTIYDSHVERRFASMLDNAPTEVRLFTKLPRRFRVATPVGEYSPDWAIVYQGDNAARLFLVRETKDTLNLADLEWDEAMRIRFAKHHFDAAPAGEVHFAHTTDQAGLRLPEDPH